MVTSYVFALILNMYTLRESILLRLAALALPVTLILLGLTIYADDRDYWIFMLLVAMVLGYMHFIVGTTYQVKGLLRKTNWRQYCSWFVIIAIVTFVFCQIAIYQGYAVVLGLFTIIYFLVHTLLNEQTFFFQPLQIKISSGYLFSFLALLVPPFFSSLLHPSFFYDFKLQYAQMSPTRYYEILEAAVPLFLLNELMLIVSALFTIIVPILFYRQYSLSIATPIFLIGVLVTGFLWFGPLINFVFILHLILVFHFILLSLIFIRPMRRRSKKAFNWYVILHLLVIVPLCFVALGYFVHPEMFRSIFQILFNFGMFLSISIVHISVSFLNEKWFQRLIGLQ